MPEGFLKILPKIAGHPLAILAYIILVGSWLICWQRSAKSNDFLQALDKTQPDARARFVRDSGYKYDELAQVPKNQRLKLLTRRYVLFAVLASIVALVLIVLAVFKAKKIESGDHTRIVEALEKGRSELNRELMQESLRSAQLARRVVGVAESASTAARLTGSPEIQRIADALKAHIRDFDARFPDRRAELFHGAGVFAVLLGPDGTPHVKAGETVTCMITLVNLDEAYDSLVISNLVLQIRHASGVVKTANLFPMPIRLSNYLEKVTAIHTFQVSAADGPVLRVDAMAQGIDNEDGSSGTKTKRNFFVTFPGQIKVS